MLRVDLRQGPYPLSLTLVADRAGHGVENDETGIDCPSQCGLIKGAWSQAFRVKLHDASTNIASSVDELRVVRGPTPAYSSLTPQSNAGVPDRQQPVLWPLGPFHLWFFILRVLSQLNGRIMKKLAGAHGRGAQVGPKKWDSLFCLQSFGQNSIIQSLKLGSRNIWSTCLALEEKEKRVDEHTAVSTTGK